MAKLRTFQSIDNTAYVYLFSVDPLSFSSNDKDLMAKYGEPEINFGGNFDNGSGITFTLPDKWVRIVSGMPHKETVDATAVPWDTDTTVKLALYRTTMQTRFTTAITSLRTNSDTFTNEYITNV